MFCAQAGAAKVYAVEASRLANLTREVVAKNGFSHVIEVRIALSYWPDIRSLTLIFMFIIVFFFFFFTYYTIWVLEIS